MSEDPSGDGNDQTPSDGGAYFLSVADASRDCIRVLDADGLIEFMNARGKVLFEIADFERNRGRYWPSQWPLESQAVVEDALAQARAGQVAEFRGFCPTARGTPKWWDTVVSPIFGDDRRVVRLLATSRDVTVERQTEAHRQLLVNELNHRVKNTLAIIQSVATQSLRNAGVGKSAREAFEGRLMAISATHNVLTTENWEAVGLREIVLGGVAPYCARPEQLAIHGEPLRMAPKAAVTLALGFHELAINAVKYGALSADGAVVVDWQADRRADRLTMCWKETGGPIVTLPKRRGFGSRIIELALPAELRGAVEVDYRPEGVVCTMQGVLSAVEALA
ncbi:MAG: signal transduction histidine kinase [Caulobacter sp.]|nr:signal transduction histidine kinase [Caulobacter sp.]